jgi:hypothetical protein
MKVVINGNYGGFSISKKCAEYMAARGNERARLELQRAENASKEDKVFNGGFYGFGYVEGMDGQYDRTDPDLIAAVEEMGTAAGGQCATLKIVKIPDGIEWKIDNYDGYESIEEAHRSWG